METDEKRIDAALDEKEDSGTWPAWVSAAIDFRALIIPRPGKKMIVSDLTQIEPRVMAWLGGNKELLKLVSEGMGIYEAFGRSSMGYTGPAFDSAFKRTDYYKMLKIQVLGLGYGAGHEKFISIALNNGGIDLTKDDPEFVEIEDPYTHEKKKKPGYGAVSKAIVKNFRESNPHITKLWAQLDDAFKRSIGSDFTMTLPSGRKMVYSDVCASVAIEKDAETGKPRRVSKFSAEIGGRRVLEYGGKLTENLVQAVARDVFMEQVMNMSRKGWPVLFSVHDEVVLEVEASVTPADVEREMARCPDWIKGLPVAAEAKEVSHYCK